MAQVQKGGAGQALWPRECESVEDLPGDLSVAIDQAYRVLAWMENFTEEELPPAWMWHLDHELKPWFEEVVRARNEKYNTGKDDGQDLEEAEGAIGWRP